MKKLTPALFLLLAGIGCSRPPEDLNKPFQGTWIVVGKDGKSGGKQVVFTNDIGAVLATVGGAETSAKVQGLDKFTIQVDRDKAPAHLNFVYVDGEHQGKSKLAIFEFDGDDRLKICVADFGGSRPTAFTAAEGTTLLVMERKK